MWGFTVDDKTIEASPAPKQPYVRPQLHELDVNEADGKAYRQTVEMFPLGPS
jgi:hypothetical protein